MQLPSRPNICTFLRMFFTWSALLFLFFIGGILPVQAASITFVQHASKDAGITSSSSLSFPANNTAGDWIAVCIRAGKSGQVLTVKDSNGNTYHSAFQFNVTADTPNGETVGIFYAENIAGGANTVTVSESITSNTLRFAILEYSGVATANSLDVAVGAQGTSAFPNSGATTTTVNGDLLLGVAVTANGATDTAGSGFVLEDRVPAAPNTKLITESQIQSTAGAASASASLGASDIWCAALAAFKAASAGSLPPSITSLNPTSGPVGTSVTITGANFGATQSASTVTFNGTTASPTAWSATSITVPVPPGATSGNVIVTVGGLVSNGLPFTVIPPPLITSLNPVAGRVATSVMITGTNFGATQGTSTVTFVGTVGNNAVATPTSWSNTSVVVPVPSGATTGNIVLQTNGGFSSAAFTVTPTISNVSPPFGPVGASLSISGSNFGTSGVDTITFNGTPTYVTALIDTGLTVTVPSGAATGPLVVTVGGSPSNPVNFTVTPVTITSISPTSGPVGTPVTITGTNFGPAQGSGTVTFSNVVATPTSWSQTSIVVLVPAGVPAASTVTVNSVGTVSNGVNFNLSPPTITSLNPPSGLFGTSVTITGKNFGGAQGLSTVSFNGTALGVASWSDASIVTFIPNGATSGPFVVTTSSGTSNGVSFTVIPPPTITGLSPTSGAAGTPVTITGTSFAATQGTGTVSFNGTSATPTSWSDTSISVTVPAGATTGAVVVSRNSSVSSNGVNFTVVPPPPSITSLSPPAAAVGALVVISGANFGLPQGTSTVTFNGTPAGPIATTGWSSVNITVQVPAGATTGNVVVTVGGVASNGVLFTVTPPPNVTSLSPASGPVGTAVTIAGSNFGATQGFSAVIFNGTTAKPASWSDTSITVPVPAGATTGNVVVDANGVNSNGVSFTVIPPAAGIKLVQHASKDAGITTSSSLAFPSNNTAGNWIAVCIRAGKAGQVITVSDSRGNAYHQAVLFNMTVDSDTLGVFYAENIAGGANTITVSDTISTGTLRFAIFEYSGIATANSLDNSAAAEGVSAAPSSGNAATTANGDLVLGTILTANPATFTAGSGFSIEATAPAEPNAKVMVEDGLQALAGPVSATASLASSDSWGAAIAAFKSAGGGAGAGPTISGLSPTSGPAGTPVTITGTNFGTSQGSSTVTFNGTPAAPTSWSTTSIGIPVPAGATTGNVVLTVGGIQSNGVNFITGPISVTVSPTAPTVAAGTTQSFTASLQNDPSSLGVTWSLSGAGCTGVACGTLSSMTPASVIYTAPNPAPNPATVSVVATSVTDNTKSATASVTIGPPPQIAVSVSPATSTVSINLTQLFSATVQYDFSNQGVNWTLSGAGCTGTACGTLTNPTSNGSTFGITYTAPSAVPAPATVSITATSGADSTKSGSSTITVSQGIPTSLGWYQIPNTLLQPVCPNIPQIQGAIGCQGVIAAWNGGIADTNRNRLLFTGGGHQNYWGNEVYSLNLSDLTLTRINNPVFPSSIPSCTEDWGNPPTVPSTPAARETYSGLAYLQHLDKMWLFGGALGTSGCRSTGMWMLDLPTLTWQRMDPTNGTQETVYTDINYADYDPQTKLVYVYIANNDVLASYNPDTNTMTELLNHNSYGVGAYSNGVLDPKRHLFVILGAGFAGSYDLTTTPPTFRKFSSQTVGCSGIQGPNYPGLAYDPVQDKIVGWAGGNTVYLFDTPTLTCTAVTYPGGPPAQQTNGTYGRWRYFPALNVFAVVNDWKQNAYTLRLTPAP
jgi:hypothetical protein